MAYAAYELKPELMWSRTSPFLPFLSFAPLCCRAKRFSSSQTATPLRADAPPPTTTYLDPTTSTPFASNIVAPDGTRLRLVGTGVRVVSFLSIRVYTVGWYVSQREFEQLQAGKLEGWKVRSFSTSSSSCD